MAKPSKMEPARFTAQFGGDLVEEIQEFRNSQPIAPPISDTLRYLVRAGLKAVRASPLSHAGNSP